MKPHTTLAMACSLIALSAGLSACRDANAPPQPGTAMASLTTPSRDDGAVVVVLTGQDFSNVQTANSAYRIYWRLAPGQEVRVAVIGNLVPGPLFTVTVSDARNLGGIHAAVADAASRADASRTTLDGYAVTLTGAGTP